MINNKKVLSIVIARKGSQGIKGKNYKMLCGKPLFIWSLLSLINSKYTDFIAISSNCENVKKFYKDFIFENNFDKNILDKLCFIDRPDIYGTNISPNEESLIHACEYLKEKMGLNFDIILHLQPTSPLRRDNLLDQCLTKYIEGNHDSLLTGTKITPFLWQKQNFKWIYEIDNTKNCCKRRMRQELREDEKYSDFVFFDCGSVYITDRDVLLNTKCRIGKKNCVYPIDKIQSLQIDDEDDYVLIENIIKSKNWINPID
jgi:N-acylneuraminate cytidylyltransferase/CMP-N,N'-diacetyllegionaminic acid synthase